MKQFDNYISNLSVLSTAYNENLENELIISGITRKFYIQFELAWKVLKELLRYEGNSIANTGSPREIIKAACAVYDFIDEPIWLSMLKDRNSTTHIYDGDAAKDLVQNILNQYIPIFSLLKEKIEERYQDIIDSI